MHAHEQVGETDTHECTLNLRVAVQAEGKAVLSKHKLGKLN